MGTKQGTYIDRIERDHPGYIHEMLRYAMKIESDTATWKELAMAMQANPLFWMRLNQLLTN